MTRLLRQASVIGLICALAACAPDGTGGTNNIVTDIGTLTGSTAGLSPEQRALRSRQQDYARARVGSAFVGAMGGALLCALQDCRPEQTAAAAAAGAAAAYLAGGYLTNQNESFQATQQTLQRDIELAQQDVARLSQSVDAAEQVVAFQRSEIARLNEGYSAGTVSEAQYKAELATMQADVQATQALIGTSTERLDGLQNSINNHRSAGLSTSQLTAQRSAQQAQLQQLRAAEQAMLANINRAPAAVKA